MISSRRVNKLILNLTLSAMFVALYVVFSRFLAINFSFFRLGFASLVLLFSSLCLGPIYGGVVGAAGDILSALIFPLGAYFPGYTFDALLQGVLPGLTVYLLKGRHKLQSIIYLILAVVISFYSVVFCAEFHRFKGHELSLVLRILIPVLILVYFTVLYFLDTFLRVKFKDRYLYKREDKCFAVFDLYLASMVNLTIISLNLLGLWNYLTIELNFWISAFTQIVIFLVEGVLKPIIGFFILKFLVRIPNFDMWILSKLAESKHPDNPVGNKENKENNL